MGFNVNCCDCAYCRDNGDVVDIDSDDFAFLCLAFYPVIYEVDPTKNIDCCFFENKHTI